MPTEVSNWHICVLGGFLGLIHVHLADVFVQEKFILENLGNFSQNFCLKTDLFKNRGSTEYK